MVNETNESKDPSCSFENLCFEGGGVRGYAYIGVIKALQDEGILSQTKRYAGTSVGALFALLLAANFTVDEIIDVKDKLDFSSLKPGWFLSMIYYVWNTFGVHPSTELENNFRSILKQKVDPDVTFKQLYDLTQKELVVVTCCLNRKQPVYFHYKTFPNVKVMDAVMASISVPFVFQPKICTFLGTEDYYVDGGVVDNYPIWVFNDLDALYNDQLYKVEKDDINKKTLGFKLLCPEEHNNLFVYHGRKEISNVVTFSSQLVNTLMLQIERSEISESYIRQTVAIPTGSVNFMNFEITDAEIKFLLKNGEESVKKYMEKLRNHDELSKWPNLNVLSSSGESHESRDSLTSSLID